MPVKYIETDIVPTKYRNFILNMQNYSLKNATFESGGWKYVKSGATITAPNNTNIGNDSPTDIVPAKANASLFAPSVGTWIDDEGQKRTIDLTMYSVAYNGGGISSWYGKKNTLSFMAGSAMGSQASGIIPKPDENGRYGITLRCIFTFHDTSERVPDDFCGVTGFNDLDGYYPSADPAEGIECMSGFDAQYMRKDVKLGSYGTNGWGGTLCDAGDEGNLESESQAQHRYSATWTGSEFTIRYSSGQHPYVHSNFATPILYDSSAYKINLKVIDKNGKILQNSTVAAQAKLGESWDLSATLPKIYGYSYKHIADGSDPISGTIGSSNQRDQDVTVVYQKLTYNVTFIDGYTGKTIDTQIVEHGESASAPAYPKHNGYTATGWDKSLDNITSDTKIALNYHPNQYTIKFEGNGDNVEGTTADKSMKYDKTDTLTPNGYSRAGYIWLDGAMPPMEAVSDIPTCNR